MPPHFTQLDPTPVAHHRRRCPSLPPASHRSDAFPPSTAHRPTYISRAQPRSPTQQAKHNLVQLPKNQRTPAAQFAARVVVDPISSICMGNFASCTLARMPGSATGARVVLPDGGVRLVGLPATAAELMLEAPGHFLADARGLQAGRRIAALGADEDLELGGVYAALPMKRLAAPAEPADVARIAAAVAREAQARRSASAKVAAVVVAPPELVVVAASVVAEEDAPIRAPRLDEMAVDDAAAAAEIGKLKQRISGCRRSRRPTLETIHEESYAYAAAGC